MMKLSEAIRLGAMLRPQARYHYLGDGKSCATGAALEALGIPLQDTGSGQWRNKAAYEQAAVDEFKTRPEYKEWGKLATPNNRFCPACHEDCDTLTGAIIHLNNNERWTRERIADWIQTIEESLEPAPVAPACEAREEAACLAK